MSDALSTITSGKTPKRLFRDIGIFFVVLAISALTYEFGVRASEPEPPPPKKMVSLVPSGLEHLPVESDVQMAIILDTSSSMDGLIVQAREQMLDIVEDLRVGDDGKPLNLAIALYRYGTKRASKTDGYIECLVPLTTDHSRVVEALGWMKAGGQKEYAPMAISQAVKELAWDLSPTTPKVIVIVGNESFSAGPVNTDDAMAAAKKKKIKILPIYCVGQHASTSAVSGWRRAAFLAGADFQMIDPLQVAENLNKPIVKPVRTVPDIPDRPPAEPFLGEDNSDHSHRKVKMKEIPVYKPRKKTSGEKQYYPAASRAPSKVQLKPQSAVGDFRSGVRKGVKGVLKSY